MHVEWKAAGRALLVLCRPFQKPAESAAISVTLSFALSGSGSTHFVCFVSLL